MCNRLHTVPPPYAQTTDGSGVRIYTMEESQYQNYVNNAQYTIYAEASSSDDPVTCFALSRTSVTLLPKALVVVVECTNIALNCGVQADILFDGSGSRMGPSGTLLAFVIGAVALLVTSQQ